jgi:soluble cytochrome b562
MFNKPSYEIRPDEFYIPEATTEEIFDTVFESSLMQGTIGSNLRRMNIEEAQKSGPKVDPEQLKQEFGIDFDAPHTRLAAQMIKDSHEEEMKVADVMSRAPQTIFGGKVLPFLAGAAGALSDPVDFGIGWLTGSVFGSAAKAIKGYQAGMAVTELSKRATFLADVTGNILSNSVTESFNMSASVMEQKEYTANDFMKNTMIASIAFPAAIYGMRSAVGKLFSLGPTAMDQIGQINDIATKNNVDPTAIAPILHNAIDRDLEIDEVFASAVRESFPNHAKDLLQDDMNIRDFREKLMSLEDQIDEAQMDQFLAKLDENGVSERKLNYLINEDATIVFDDATIKEVESAINDPKNKLHYIDGQEEVQNAPTAIDIEKFDVLDQEILKENQRLEQFDGVVLHDPIEAENVRIAKADADEQVVIHDALKSYSECMGLLTKEVLNG